MEKNFPDKQNEFISKVIFSYCFGHNDFLVIFHNLASVSYTAAYQS